jgi:predicted aspartyl protease
MEPTHIEGTVIGAAGESRTVRFLLDSGTKYTVVPLRDWQALGLAPMRRATFVLADGTHIDRELSECRIALPQGEGHSPVILGEADDAAVLGIITLEKLGLVLHPFTRALRPAGVLHGAQRLRRG